VTVVAVVATKRRRMRRRRNERASSSGNSKSCVLTGTCNSISFSTTLSGGCDRLVSVRTQVFGIVLHFAQIMKFGIVLHFRAELQK